jgi:hypothetical protein
MLITITAAEDEARNMTRQICQGMSVSLIVRLVILYNGLMCHFSRQYIVRL